MRKAMCFVIISLLIAGSGCATATGLSGRKVVVTAGQHESIDAPVSIPVAGDLDDTSVCLRQVGSDKTLVGTVHNGELVFVPEDLAPNTRTEFKLAARDADAPRVVIEKKDGDDMLDVTIDGEQFTAYNYSNDNKKPFLWPVYVDNGVTITRDWPMGEIQSTKDHVHHKAIYCSYGKVNGADCWGEGDRSGFQHSDNVTYGSGDAYGWIRAENTWQDNAHKPVLSETREYRFYPTPATARLFDVTVTFTANYGDVLFGDTKEGGILAVRIRDEIRGKENGEITNALGKHGESECWGKPSPWCDYSGPIEGLGVRGLAIFDAPTNLRHPTRWHVRDYGLMAANCFGLSYFTKKEDTRLNGDFTLKAGESLTFKYRVYIHAGDAAEAQVDARYADFATPPKAEWKN